MKKSKLLIGVWAVLIIVWGIMLLSKVKDFNNNDNEIVNKTAQEISTSNENLEPEVKNAMEQLYKLTGDNKNRVMYEYAPNDNYIMEPFINSKYYVFNVYEMDGNGKINNVRKCNYLLNMENGLANVYFAGGQMNPLYDGNSWKVNPNYEKYYYSMDKSVYEAYNRIAKKLGNNLKYYKYQYDPEAEENGNKRLELNNEYYIFIDYTLKKNGDFDERGYKDLAVKKSDLSLYEYDTSKYPENHLIPYGKKEETKEKVRDWQEYCKKAHAPYGYNCSDAEEHRMLRRDLNSTSFAGMPGNNIDIEAGVDWYKNECISMHNGECKDIGEHQAKIIASMDEYSEIGAESEEVFKVLSEACYQGFEYARFLQDDYTIDEYLNENMPTDIRGINWEIGFMETFEKYKNYR